MFLQQRQKAALDKFRSGTNVGKEICLFSQLERHPLPLPLKKKRMLRLLRNKSSSRFFSRLIFLCWGGLQILERSSPMYRDANALRPE